MASKAKGKGQEASRIELDSDPTVVECIRAIAAYNARANLDSEHQMTLFLKSWWSSTYNRPLKDPLLESYSLEELIYEFYDKMERQKAAEERVAKEADKMEAPKEKEALDWAEAEEQKELEEMKQKAAKGTVAQAAAAAATDPTKDPANIQWMNEQLAKAKEIHGETFGEDFEETFDEDVENVD